MPIKRKTKIAIIHDHLLYFGGAERVLWTLIKMYPDAHLYTAFASSKIINQLKQIHHGNYHISIYDNFPLSHKYPDIYKPFINLYWESLDLSKYDLVISSSHSFSAKSVITKPPTKHISYIHTPPKYLYTEFNETKIIQKPFFKILLSPLMAILRIQDYLGAQRPDILIANSKEVQKRIWKYYRRESIVICPPVTMPNKIIKSDKKEYFLVISRLVSQKGIDLAIQACNELKLPLVIIGEGKEKEYLQSISGSTIKFLGFVEDNKIPEIYSKTKALIYCSKDEDFGMVPVEAMSHGVPVIAYNSGAIPETVIDKKNGILFDKYSVESLINAIKEFNLMNISPENCRKQAKKFNNENFEEKINKLI